MNHFNHYRYVERYETRLQRGRHSIVMEHLSRKFKLRRIREISSIFIISQKKEKYNKFIALNIASFIRFF